MTRERRLDLDWSVLRRHEQLSVPERLSIDIERLILDGRLAPGERLPTERELAEMLDVSRVSVREALRELERRQLIERRRGRGTIVLSPAEPRDAMSRPLADVLRNAGQSADAAQISRIMELRLVLEPPIAALAAMRVSPRDVVQLEELVVAMEGEADPAKYAELDRAFHHAIAQYSYNPLLVMLTEQIATLIAPSRDVALQSPERLRSSSRAHRAIYEAIAASDGAGAESQARLHVTDVWGHIEGRPVSRSGEPDA